MSKAGSISDVDSTTTQDRTKKKVSLPFFMPLHLHRSEEFLSAGHSRKARSAENSPTVEIDEPCLLADAPGLRGKLHSLFHGCDDPPKERK